jgi:GH25 family lysozyme M1 (1,4-beta-N-acetylmuramidase)
VLNGIDVSDYQGNFPWQDWRGKIAFAGIRITEGLTEADPCAARNVAGARSIGAMVIGYHFLHAGEGGAPQARYFLEQAARAGLTTGWIPAVDVEDGGLDGLPPAKADLVAAGFTGWIHDHAGAWPACYTEQWLAPFLAHGGPCPYWPAAPDGSPVVLPAGPWKAASFAQTGQRGVDADVFYGTAAELAKLAIPHT